MELHIVFCNDVTEREHITGEKGWAQNGSLGDTMRYRGRGEKNWAIEPKTIL